MAGNPFGLLAQRALTSSCLLKWLRFHIAYSVLKRWWWRDEEMRGGRTAEERNAMPPGIEQWPQWDLLSAAGRPLRRAFVSHGVKTPCKYARFINMTWSSSAKCKEVLPPGTGRKEEEMVVVEEEREAIKSSATLSLPGPGWLSVNCRRQRGFIGDF